MDGLIKKIMHIRYRHLGLNVLSSIVLGGVAPSLLLLLQQQHIMQDIALPSPRSCFFPSL